MGTLLFLLPLQCTEHGCTLYITLYCVLYRKQNGLQIKKCLVEEAHSLQIFFFYLYYLLVSMFLIKNLNQVFAPAIAKLYKDKKIDELDELFKKTTFIVNLITLPFMIIIIIFAMY